MNKIIVIGTTHSEKGRCNSDSLYHILNDIKPQVLYLEAKPIDYEKVLNNQLQDSLETQAIKQYLKTHTPDHLAVDINDMPSREKFRKMINTFINNIEYQRVNDEYNELCHFYGFKFLNSSDADQMQDYLHFLESDIVKSMNIKELTDTYNEAFDLHTSRENHWISKITEHQAKSEFQEAVFLVGAGHRITIKEKLQKLDLLKQSTIHWDFEYFRN
ncbi:hypothetical protein [Roseivirga pacifica]|uniref:hypothetical protein n=1 Tax=Roseivirga pacifica TaxID=1267423 RepID=UPI00209467D1|nr:hypothetical protein [Roseivirga pacifica]MCO6360635.1 hypothetical protein [Roseivirga pacifica]MCO6368524.1 hypothetical protein [Roseivirga pacifica]MCO6372666.1 hypothetical protein [Roseivirga pacifica]MCO6376724.1 hypothetical protein [Roseivirga pacifica]MCO6377996.1 hypothetical protein [Roseivirga pacifica]